MDLSTIDLNLLVYLDALLLERHVTNAGKRLGLSQSAMSRALSRLRAVFDDELLVKTTSGMTPTPLAEQLEPQVRRMLGEIAHLLRVAQPFDPSTSQGHISVALDPWAIEMLEELLLFGLDTPNLTLRLEPMPQDLDSALAFGAVDLALYFSPLPGSNPLGHTAFLAPAKAPWLHIIGSPMSLPLEELLRGELGIPIGATSRVVLKEHAPPALPSSMARHMAGDWVPTGLRAHLCAHTSHRAAYPQAVAWLLAHLGERLVDEGTLTAM